MAHDHHVYMLLTEAAAQQRDAAALALYAPRLEALAARDGHRLYQGIAARALGVAQRLAGEHAASAAAFDQAQALFTGLGTQWQLGRTLCEQAELELARHAPAAAHDHYRRAQAAFAALGALPDLERTSAAIAALAA
jgi:hypothetical protein